MKQKIKFRSNIPAKYLFLYVRNTQVRCKKVNKDLIMENVEKGEKSLQKYNKFTHKI